MIAFVLFIAFLISLGVLGGFLLGAYAVTRTAEERIEELKHWRTDALLLQQRVHELELESDVEEIWQ